MWLTRVSELSEVCLMCLAMTDTLQADRNLWIGTTNSSVVRFQDKKPPDAKSKVYTNDDLSHPGTESSANRTRTRAASQPALSLLNKSLRPKIRGLPPLWTTIEISKDMIAPIGRRK